MTSISFRATVRISITASIALTAATLATAQTPGYIPEPPAKSGAKPAAPNEKAAAPEGKASSRAPRTKAPAEPSAAAPPPEESPVDPLAWLAGCWSSDVNKRETREHWLPLRGNLMLGMSQTVVQGKTQDYEYLRMESRPDGVYYVVLPAGQNATTFKFEGHSTITMGDRSDDAFTFTNPALEFPSKIVYRRARQGWLYVSVEGKVKGSDKEVTYPMRRINCETGELIER
ncbi:MAG TPA: DUF6265 family protein [Casimicrobiaceae bacterium]|nr:DUF6265 family protein [Casimicrobiaceae bacterium]